MPRLDRSFFTRDVELVARNLLGCVLVRMLDGERLAGRIVEVEAYLGAPDKAAHTYNHRRTPRNESMYKTGGHAYVYFTYGMHHCMNVVAGAADQGVAVLLRALEPLEGIDTIRRRRLKARRDRDLCSGPARLCQALAIDRTLDGEDLVTSDRLWIEQGEEAKRPMIATSARVGVAYAQEWATRPLRFYEPHHPHVSPGKPTTAETARRRRR